VQEGSPVAERGVLPTLAELGRMPVIAFSKGTYGIESLLRMRGFEANVVFRTDESGAVQRLVAAGIGSALVARLSIDQQIPGVVAFDASRRVPPRAIGLVWHRDSTLSDAARSFIAAAQTRCDELSSDMDVISPQRGAHP
jgi:DNA-binding transcriptional LysR family regulator